MLFGFYLIINFFVPEQIQCFVGGCGVLYLTANGVVVYFFVGVLVRANFTDALMLCAQFFNGAR